MCIPKFSLILILFTCLCCGCRSQPLNLSKETEIGVFKYDDHDNNSVFDLMNACQTGIIRISDVLKLETNRNIIIEIYPDQSSYDRFIINPDLRGSPAISGGDRIQLVSPLSKIKIDTISYPNRLKFLTHEYVHVMLSQIKPEIPVWLNEGLACYYGSYDFYYSVVKSHFGEFKFFPSFDQLQHHYDEIPAADVYSFLVVDYLLNAYSIASIDYIIRHPDDILSVNKDWIPYITGKYGPHGI